MRTRLFKALTLLIALSLAAATGAKACGDIQPQRVSISGTFDDDSGTDFLGNSNSHCSLVLGPGGGADDGRTNLSGEAFLYPGKVYTLSYSAQNMTNLVIGLTAPSGYNLYINGVLKITEQVFGTGGYSTGGATYTGFWSVELRAKICGDPPGYSSGLKVGDVIWEVGLGQLNNGDLPGKIVIHEGTFTTGLFNRTALNCMATSPDMEVILSSGLRQVRAPETFVNIHDITNGFQVDFYPTSAITGTSGGLYTFTGSPFVSYAITNGGTANQVKVVRTAGAGTPENTTANYNWTDGSTWNSMVAAARNEVKTDSTNVDGNRVEITVVQDGSGMVASKTKRIYHTYAWGEELIQVEEDPDGRDYTTKYSYYDAFDLPNNHYYSKLASTTGPTGSWVVYDYYTDPHLYGNKIGQVFHEYHPWLNNDDNIDPTTVTDSNCDVITYDYETDWLGQGTLLSSKIEKIKGVTVAQQAITNDISAAANGADIWTQTQTDSTSSSGSLVTVTKTYRPDQIAAYAFYDGKPYSTQHPDGTMESYVQIQGTYNPSTHSFTAGAFSDLEEIVLHGVTPAVGSVSGGTSAPAIGSYTFDPIYLMPNQSTKTVTYRQFGWVMRDETYVYACGTFNLVSWNNYTYTPTGDLTSKVSSNGATYTATYTNGLKTDATDETGIETTYTYDTLRRVNFASKLAGPGYSGVTVPGDITTQYVYDAESNVLGTFTTGSGGLSQTSSSTYDKAGRLTSMTTPEGYVTSFDDASGGKIETMTYPGGATKITTYNLDGSVSNLTGTALVAVYYAYSIDGSGDPAPGFRTVKQYNGANLSGNWTAQKSDWLGRPVLATRLDAAGNTVSTSYLYNSLGQLSKTTVAATGASMAPTLYSYNAMGALALTAVDADNNGAITLSGPSPDRVTAISTSFTSASSSWWQTTVQQVYASTSTATPTTVQTTDIRLNGFTGNGRTETHATDIDGNVTVQTTSVDSASHVVTSTTTVPNSVTASQQIAYNGLTVSSQSTHGVITKFSYDGLGRLSKTVDPRKGGIITSYVTGTSQVAQTSIDGGPVLTNYTYGADGRVSTTSNANGNTSRVTYGLRGEVLNRWGDGTDPVSYTYDSFGRMTQQITYRDFTNSKNWTTASFPTGLTSLADTTTFAYYGDLPLLQHKQDATSHATSYTYDAFGRVTVRTNARSTIPIPSTVTSTYDSATGDLTKVEYSDAHSVEYTYTRTGAMATMIDATGTHAFNYGTDLQLGSEVLPAGYYKTGRQISYTHAPSGVKGRLTGMSLEVAGTPGTTDQATTYDYRTDGRLNTVTANGAGYASHTFTYTYTAGADNLIAGIGDSVTSYSQVRSYHSQWDVLTSMVNKNGTVPQAQYDYTYNNLGQRDSALQSGTAFADLGNSSYYKYTYNGQGELAQAYGYLGTSVTGGGDPVLTGRTYQYTYDHAGNRLTMNHTLVGGLLENFVSNNLNQIAQRDNHTVSVQGVAASGASVAISSSGAGGTIDVEGVKSGNYWGSEAVLNNATAPAYQTINVTSALPGGGTSHADLIGHDSRNAFLAADPEMLKYDEDGNMVSDGHWTYAWNAANQLIQMVTTDDAARAGAPNVRLTFEYDGLGRRTGRKIEDKTGGTWVTREELRFVYDGWNLIAEMSTAGTIQRYFTWGLDLAGSPSAMGGIGALLMIQDTLPAGANSGQHTFLPEYDGSGNVTALFDSVGGSVAALYEYSPFGELLRSEGYYAASNRFRWSTHFTDDDTGLTYYGHRYYSSSLGRFINRDPIEEQGGINLYGFAGNNPANGFDVLGLDTKNDDSTTTLLPPIVVGRSAPVGPDPSLKINPGDFTSGSGAGGGAGADGGGGSNASPNVQAAHDKNGYVLIGFKNKAAEKNFRRLALAYESLHGVGSALLGQGTVIVGADGKLTLASLTLNIGTSYEGAPNLAPVADATSAPNSGGSLTLGDQVRILMGVASAVSPGNPVAGMIDKGVAVGQMTGSVFTGINAAINPAYGVLEGAYENATGLSLNPDTPQATLTFGQRVLSGISSELNLAGTIGVGMLGADLLAPSLTPANSLLGADIGWKGGEITFTVPGEATPDLRINPTGDWSNTNPNAQLPHYHSRPGIGWHRPWEGPE